MFRNVKPFLFRISIGQCLLNILLTTLLWHGDLLLTTWEYYSGRTCLGLTTVNMSAKASKTLNFLHHTLWGATTEAKSITYKCLVRPLLEYACLVWNPHTVSDKVTLESVQRRAAHWVCGSCWSSGENIGVNLWMVVYKSYIGLLFRHKGTT